MIDRRTWLTAAASASAALWLQRTELTGQQAELLTRAIPSSNERIPAVGLGSARTFSVQATPSELAPLREVLRHFHRLGGRVFDTAPTYGEAERVSGQLAQELGIQDDLFFATKISTRGGRDSGLAQERGSQAAWGRQRIDLNQVHNLRGVDVHLPALRQAKAAGRVRYVGVTTSRIPQHSAMEEVLRSEEVDFVQLNYSLGERQAAERLIPLAEDRGVAVMVNEPFDGGRLFRATRGRDVPQWAADFDCESWGQFFLKYILANPTVTVVIPATSNPDHVVDNMSTTWEPEWDGCQIRISVAAWRPTSTRCRAPGLEVRSSWSRDRGGG